VYTVNSGCHTNTVAVAAIVVYIYTTKQITEYLCEPLRRALRDEDPYVRKTAAVCVAKLYDINAVLVEVRLC
jgi:HEAT repeat protein